MTIGWLLIMSLATLYCALFAPIRFVESPSFSYKYDDRSWIGYDTNGDQKVDYVQKLESGVKTRFFYDTDHDGALETIIDKSKLKAEGCRQLIVCLDSVPFGVMDELWDEGHFRLFNKPGRLISPFPSLSWLARSRIWHLKKPDGYEYHFFDKTENELKGGIAGYAFHEEPLDSLVEYRWPYIFDGLAYVLSDLSYYETRKLKRVYGSSDEKVVVLFVSSADGLAHKYGKKRLKEFLVNVDRMLEKITFESMNKTQITLFSEHGNNLVESKRIRLEEHLRKAGFRITDKIEKSNDVVIPKFGLVGCVIIYTQSENKSKVAQALKTLDGVDFSIYKENGKISVVGKKGLARISFDKGKYKYDPLEGDPLELGGVLNRLRSEGKIDENGYAEDEYWEEATFDHLYPDPLRRIRESIYCVENEGDVVVSLEDGYYFGSKRLDIFTGIQSTHGSLLKKSTYGFFTSTVFKPPPYIRADEVMGYINKHLELETRASKRKTLNNNRVVDKPERMIEEDG